MNTILVPLDGSKFAEAALPVALELAGRLRARVEFVGAYEEESVLAGPPLYGDREKMFLDGYLSTLVDRHGAESDVAVSYGIVSGPVADRLVEYTQRIRAALVVMATHGRGALSKAWLGSVADRMVRRVSMPLILIRPREEGHAEAASVNRMQRILVALDGSETAEASLTSATTIGRATGATYTLVRVVPPSFPPTPYSAADGAGAETSQVGRDAADAYLREVASGMRADGLPVETMVEEDVQPATGILRCARTTDADLIAVATHGRSGVARLILGSVADKVIRGATGPVLVTRPDTEIDVDL